MVTTNHYRWDFIGLSTDAKPTAENPKVVDGSTYYESDTSKAYVWYKDQWYEKTATGGGGYELPIASASTLGGVKIGEGLTIDAESGVLAASGGGDVSTVKTLTEADFNYPIDNPSQVALWLLPAGFYRRGSLDSSKVLVASSIYLRGDEIAFVGLEGSYGIPIYCYTFSATANNGNVICTWYTVIKSIGIAIYQGNVCQSIDDLTSTSTEAPLSANQGRILDEKISALEARVSALEGN